MNPQRRWCEYQLARQLLHLCRTIHGADECSTIAQELPFMSGQIVVAITGACWETSRTGAVAKLGRARQHAESVMHDLARLRRRRRGSLPHVLAAQEIAERLHELISTRMSSIGTRS